MAIFKTALDLTIIAEGGYSNNPKDKGGETYKGISRIFFPLWKGWEVIDNYKQEYNFPENLKGLLRLSVQVEVFYKTNFWDLMSLDKLDNQDMANELFDTAVNMGVHTSSNWFQRCLNVSNEDSKGNMLFPNLVVDNVIGSKTIASYNSLNQQYQNLVLKLFNCFQGVRYINICETDRTQKLFMFGWSKRVSY